MSSYFNLILDTTSPVITLKCPSRTIPNNVVEIMITSNEELDVYQEIYIIDSKGERKDLIFALIDEYTFLGYIDFQMYPIGMCQMYIRLRDKVFNPSNIIEHQIYVGYISQSDNYDAHVNAIEVDKPVECEDGKIITSHLENKQVVQATEVLKETKVSEREIKVGVIEYGTNWRYS
jgi:hypothetical protein